MLKSILISFVTAFLVMLSTTTANAQDYDWVYSGMVEYAMEQDVGRVIPQDTTERMYKVVYLGSFKTEYDPQGWHNAICQSRRCLMTVFTYIPNPEDIPGVRGAILPQSTHRMPYDSFPVQAYGYAPRTIGYAIEGFMTDKTTRYFFIVPLAVFFAVMIGRSFVTIIRENTKGAFADVSTIQTNKNARNDNSGMLGDGLDDDHAGAD